MVTTDNSLQTVRTTLLGRIAHAAGSGDVPGAARWSRAAQECDRLLDLQAQVEERIRTFVASIQDDSAPADLSEPEGSLQDRGPILGRREGAMVRSEWIAQVARSGVRLEGRGKRYVAPNGRTVSIGFANELPGLPNKWFLGAPDQPCDVIALLCNDSRRKVHDMVIPVAELGSRWRALARSNGQVKFNVRREGNEFLLLIPGGHAFLATSYVGRYAPLSEAL